MTKYTICMFILCYTLSHNENPSMCTFNSFYFSLFFSGELTSKQKKKLLGKNRDCFFAIVQRGKQNNTNEVKVYE